METVVLGRVMRPDEWRTIGTEVLEGMDLNRGT